MFLFVNSGEVNRAIANIRNSRATSRDVEILKRHMRENAGACLCKPKRGRTGFNNGQHGSNTGTFNNKTNGNCNFSNFLSHNFSQTCSYLVELGPVNFEISHFLDQ